jgi:hypothetical protein
MYDEIMEVSDEICNAWEIDFLESIGACLSRGIQLTDPRRETLERIYDKACKSAY